MDFLNTQEKKDRRLVHLPMGRFGEAIELAKAALFRPFSSCLFPEINANFYFPVATDESSYITVSAIVSKCGVIKKFTGFYRELISKWMEDCRRHM
jgi:hypothetical protein